MKKIMRKLNIGFLFIFSVFFVYGCNTFDNGVVTGWNNTALKVKHSPPPHAPAWGYRAQHRYIYYPDAYVYFDIERSVYYFLKNGQWYVSQSLPAYFKPKLSRSVTIEMDTDKPYLYFDKYKEKYPPARWKQKRYHSQKHGFN
ncbi:hypothetical protein [Hippea maritima]|uniref:Lipoprotein n=1 Tax=Hippea maritima (strain ATCC 700847 / DSM 10411 / MH2) TaxID=760142 RepID=F2LVC5_HIPMA|nr:hypothetical protein [Hippea maritima]AEA33709.1 hypothetical protein Hipma_0739 [Hippea maritima DSM 10411]